MRASRSAPLQDASRGTDRGVRIHRGLLQPAPSSFLDRSHTANPEAHQSAAVLAAVKDKPFGRPQVGPSLTAAARDGRTLVPAGIEEWLRRGPNKRMPTKQESKMPSDQIP